MKRKLILVSVVALVATVGIVSLATAVRAPSPTLGVLTTVPTAADRLPSEIRTSSFRPIFAMPIHARYVGTSPIGFRFFAIKGRDGYVCLIGTKGRGDAAETYGICREQKVLSKDAIWVSRGDLKGGGADIAGLAADGLTAVAGSGTGKMPIKSNAFFLRVERPGTTVTLTGEGVKTVRMSLGG